VNSSGRAGSGEPHPPKKRISARKTIRTICGVAILGVLIAKSRARTPGDTYTALFDTVCLLGGSLGILLTYIWPRQASDAMRRAILDGRTLEVRRIARDDPSVLAGRPWEERSALDLARDRGDAFTEVALIRLEAPGSDEATGWDALLRRYLDQLCHRIAAASWVGGVEFDLWRAVVGGEPLSREEDPHGFSQLDAPTLGDLRFLVKRCDGWFAWDEKVGGVAFVPRAEWVRRYVRWRKEEGGPGAVPPQRGSS
jgi:hypothetical protein